MIRESEVNAENDKRKRDLIEEINKAESIMHDTESKMEEFKTQLPVQEYDSLKVQISQIKEKILKIDRENDSIDMIKPLVDEFQKSSLKLFEMAYKKVFCFLFCKNNFQFNYNFLRCMMNVLLKSKHLQRVMKSQKMNNF
jgi:hypothetical protein